MFETRMNFISVKALFLFYKILNRYLTAVNLADRTFYVMHAHIVCVHLSFLNKAGWASER